MKPYLITMFILHSIAAVIALTKISRGKFPFILGSQTRPEAENKMAAQIAFAAWVGWLLYHY